MPKKAQSQKTPKRQPSKVGFCLKLNPRTLKRVRAESKRLGLPCNKVIEVALEQFLQDNKQLSLTIK